MAFMLIRRYLFRHLLLVTLSLSLILSGIIWLTQSLRFVDVIVNKGLPLRTFFELTFFLIPDVLGIILPIAFFMAVVFTYNKLEVDHELMIFRAVGFSDKQLARPVILLGFFVTLFLVYINFSLMPRTLRTFKDQEHAIRNQASALLIQPGQFVNFPGITLFVRVQNPGGLLKGILIHDTRAMEQHSTLIAEEGYLRQASEGVELVLLKGNRLSMKLKEKRPEVVYFDAYTIDLTALLKTSAKEKERTRKFYEMDFVELWDSLESDPVKTLRMKAEGHKRVIMSLLALVFGFVGVGGMLWGDFSRRRRLSKILISGGMVLCLQLLVLALLNLAEKNTWSIAIIYALLGGGSVLFYAGLEGFWKKLKGVRRSL